MSVLTAYQIFGGMALALLSGLVGFLMKRNTYEVNIKGRVEALELWKGEAQACLDKVKAAESKDAVRQYRQDENDKKLEAISRQIESGFDKLAGAIAAINLQLVEIVSKAANTDASLRQAWARINTIEEGVSELRRAIEEVQKELRGVRFREDEP